MQKLLDGFPTYWEVGVGQLRDTVVAGLREAEVKRAIRAINQAWKRSGTASTSSVLVEPADSTAEG